MLSSDSGKEKHTDVEGQGSWLLYVFQDALRYVEPGPGLAFGGIRYLGVQEPEPAPIKQMDVPTYAGPRDHEQIATLQGLVRALGEAFAVLADRCIDEGEGVGDVDPSMEAAMEVAEWAAGRRPLDGITTPDWRWALTVEPPLGT